MVGFLPGLMDSGKNDMALTLPPVDGHVEPALRGSANGAAQAAKKRSHSQALKETVRRSVEGWLVGANTVQPSKWNWGQGTTGRSLTGLATPVRTNCY